MTPDTKRAQGGGRDDDEEERRQPGESGQERDLRTVREEVNRQAQPQDDRDQVHQAQKGQEVALRAGKRVVPPGGEEPVGGGLVVGQRVSTCRHAAAEGATARSRQVDGSGLRTCLCWARSRGGRSPASMGTRPVPRC